MKPIIGISGNITQVKEDNTKGFNANYSPLGFTSAIEAAGGSAIILPIMNEDNAKELISIVDGLLLTGGEDISPRHYNEEPRLVIGETHPERDKSEILLLKEAIRQKKPILGVCRGMQLINVVLGGSLYQDLSECSDITIQHVQKTRPSLPTHTIIVEEGSHLSTMYQTGDYVNSIHHQMLKDVAPGVQVTARSIDGVAEAIEVFDNNQSIIGTQWHPELNALKNNVQSFNIFKDLIERAQHYKTSSH